MKHLLVIVLVCVSANLVAQQFEGTVTWNITLNYTDPRKKQQMDETHERIKDPQTRRKLANLQLQVNDPQRQELMRRDPKARREFEQDRAALQGANLYPTGVTVMQALNGNTLTRVTGVFPDNDLLYRKDNDTTYSISREHKVYSVIPNRPRRATRPDSLMTVTRTTETAEILGYKCTKYRIETKYGGKPATQEIWATTDLKGLDISPVTKLNAGRVQWLVEKVEGTPLKMTATTREGTFAVEATKLEKTPPPSSEMTIPKNFVEMKYRPGM